MTINEKELFDQIENNRKLLNARNIQPNSVIPTTEDLSTFKISAQEKNNEPVPIISDKEKELIIPTIKDYSPINLNVDLFALESKLIQDTQAYITEEEAKQKENKDNPPPAKTDKEKLAEEVKALLLKDPYKQNTKLKDEEVIPTDLPAYKISVQDEDNEPVPIYGIETTNLDNFVPDDSTSDKTIFSTNTGIAIVDGAVNSLGVTANSIGNNVTSFFKNWQGGEKDAPQGLLDNTVLTEQKDTTRKSIDLSVQNATPYFIDDTLKAFTGGGPIGVNSIISGSLNLLKNAEELANSFYDMDEIIQLTTASYNILANDSNPFTNKGIFGKLKKYSGAGKPAIKIKSSSDGGKTYKPLDMNNVTYFGENKENLGYLYVRPFKNKIAINPFKIPFQMNAKITENEITANYVTEQFLNRVGDIMTFTGTGSLKLSLETNYVVLSDGSQNKGNDPKLSNWMERWTQSYVKTIENAYRSLVFSTYYSGVDDGGISGFLKPPVIRILMTRDSTSDTSGDLYSYPRAKWRFIEEERPSFEAYTDVSGGYHPATTIVSAWMFETNSNDYNAALKNLKADKTIAPEYSWRKAFVVTGVSISTDEESINGYSSQYYTGFKVNLTLVEVTENYLDCIPDFASYYAAYVGDIHKTAPVIETSADSTSFVEDTINAYENRKENIATDIATAALSASATTTQYYSTGV